MPGYCSITDIKDELVNLDFGTNTNLTTARLNRMRSGVNGEINVALATGGYTAPQTLTTTTTTSDAESASTDTEVIAFASVTGFSVGDTVRIEGLSTDDWNDDFTDIVAIANLDVTVFALGAAFDSGATVSLIPEGYKKLRELEKIGTALKALNAISIRSGRVDNEKIDRMREWYERQFDMIRNGELNLPGLATGNSFIQNAQTDDSDVFSESVVHKVDGDIY